MNCYAARPDSDEIVGDHRVRGISLVGVVDHVALSVKNLEASKVFYQEALKPLGFQLLYMNEGEGTVGFGTEKNDDFAIFQSDAEYPPTSSAHVAFVGKSHEAVEAFYHAAIVAGGKSKIAPKIHLEYHANYYAAYVLDPDGNNIEAVNHGPAG